jgi:hypothetical protein
MAMRQLSEAWEGLRARLMATTIAASFEGLKQNLEITALQQSTVSTRQQNVRDAVARRLTVNDSFVTGSYSRHTIWNAPAFVDI